MLFHPYIKECYMGKMLVYVMFRYFPKFNFMIAIMYEIHETKT